MTNFSKHDAVNQDLIFTGERYQPEIGGEVQLEHLHRYAMAKKMVRNKTVLDIACGEGYGAALLSETAKQVTGVDIELQAVQHAKLKYQSENLSFLQGECANIPLKENSVDVVVSFETIEHHDLHLEMMSEIKRVLKPKGFLIMSSPNKKEYSDIPGYKNPYHVKELYSEEFENLVLDSFKNIQVFRQRVIYASAVVAENADTGVQLFEFLDEGVDSSSSFRSIYDIVIASDLDLPSISHSLFEIDKANLTAGHLKHIDSLTNTLDSVISDRDSAYEAKLSIENVFNKELDQKNEHISDLSGTITAVMLDRDAAYEAKQSLDEYYKTELLQKDEHLAELASSIGKVVLDRDAAYETKQGIEDYYRAELSQKNEHLSELETSLEKVVLDRDAAYEAKQGIEDHYMAELSQKNEHLSELEKSLEKVILDRDSAYEAKQGIEDHYKEELSQKEKHVTELTASIGAVIIDRDSAYQAVRLLEEANEDLNWSLTETQRYSNEIESELNAAKGTFVWKVFGKFLKKA